MLQMICKNYMYVTKMIHIVYYICLLRGAVTFLAEV